jgi:hypothetical protein
MHILSAVNFQTPCILLTYFIYVLLMIVTVNTDYFRKQHQTACGYNETDCVPCVVRTELLCFI